MKLSKLDIMIALGAKGMTGGRGKQGLNFVL